MVFAQTLGLVAGAVITSSLVPQIIRVFKLKSAKEISLLFNCLMLIGLILWLIYGILLSLMPVILWNAISIVLTTLLLYAKLKYGK
ncbi:SemiSWEET family sugar transporter [Chloroflexota bacterium]